MERSIANKIPKGKVEDKNGSRGGVSGCWLGARKGRWLIGLPRFAQLWTGLRVAIHVIWVKALSTALYHKFGSIPLQAGGSIDGLILHPRLIKVHRI
jgi:hypothetical protein